VTILNALIANGTRGLLAPVYDPAAPFYSWHIFTIILLGISTINAVKWVAHLNASKKLLIPLVFAATNLAGYVLARLYLSTSNLRHDAVGVSTIWIITFLGGGIMASYKLTRKPQEEAA